MGTIKEGMTLPAIPELHGHVTVELFDAETGELQERHEGDNFITIRANEYFRRLMLTAIIGGVAKYGTFRPISSLRDYNAFMFQYLVLTDYSGAEAPTSDALVRGNLKGYSYVVPTADSSLLAGYANQEESWATPEQAHLVYDFATDKANGSFRSIYLSSTIATGRSSSGEFRATFKTRAARGYETSYSSICCSGGYLWCKLGNVVYKISPTTGEEVASYDMLEAVYTFTVSGGYIYYMPAAGTTVKRYQISDGAKTQVTLSATANQLVNDGTYIYACYTSNFYMSRITISTFTVDGYKALTAAADFNSGSGFQYVFVKNGVVYGAINDDKTTQDAETGWEPAIADYDAGTLSPTGADYYPAVIIASDGTNDYVFMSNTGYMSPQFTAANYGFYTTTLLSETTLAAFSRKLLASDVTKANNQTMKITYDIYIS